MASKTPEPPEGFKAADDAQSDDDQDFDTEWVDRPELGQMLQGTVLALKPDRGKYDSTVLELKLSEPYADFESGDLVCCWMTSGLDQQFDAEEVARGDEVCIACDDSFENGDGEERRSYTLYTEA